MAPRKRGPVTVGAILALSPALTGSQRSLVDVLGFALELSVEFGLLVGAIGFAIASWARIVRGLSSGRNGASRATDKYAILAGTAFLLTVLVVKMASNAPKDTLASPLDVALVGIAVFGSVVGLFLFRCLGRET